MSITEVTRMAVQLAHPEVDFFEFINDTASHLLGFFTKTQGTLHFSADESPYNTFYKRRYFCDAFIASMNKLEDEDNHRYTEILERELRSFDDLKESLKSADLAEYTKQRVRFEAVKEQELVHQEITSRFEFTHIAFVRLKDEGANFVPKRWLTVLSHTPFPPEYTDLSTKKIEQFRAQVLEEITLDDCLFDQNTQSSPSLTRFIDYLFRVKQSTMIEPILRLRDLPREPGRYCDVQDKLNTTVVQDERSILLMNALLDTFKALKALKNGSFMQIAQKCFSRLPKIDSQINVSTEIHEQEQVRITNIIAAIDTSKRRDAKCVESIPQNEVDQIVQLAEETFVKISTIYAHFRDLYTLLKISMARDFSQQDKEYADIIRSHHIKVQENTQSPAEPPQLAAVPKGKTAAAPIRPPTPLCMATPLPEPVVQARAQAKLPPTATHTVDVEMLRQGHRQKSELYNRLKSYRKLFKVYLEVFERCVPKRTAGATATALFERLKITSH